MTGQRPAANLRLATPLILMGRVLANTRPPPPSPEAGGFAADAQRIANLPALPNADGIIAGAEATRILGMTPLTAPLAQASAIAVGAAAKAYTAKVTEVGQAYLRAGSMTHEWFYRGWHRTEAPALRGVTISKPDQGLEIWIDQAARTYHENGGPDLSRDADAGRPAASDL
jgi:hypothetical protein